MTFQAIQTKLVKLLKYRVARDLGINNWIRFEFFFSSHLKYGRPCQFYCANPCNLLGRVLGHLLNFHIGLIFLPILRNSIWSLVQHCTYFLFITIVQFGKFPFERTVFFHRWIGGFTFILMLLHMITWWITYPAGSGTLISLSSLTTSWMVVLGIYLLFWK